MNIKVWTNFTKRKNSTLQPTGGSDITCVLKEETSIENPVFILNTPIAAYTYVQAFNHYYFVTDVVNLDGHRCEVHCTMDVLATYRSDILGYTAFVERSASSFDEYINDALLSSRQIIIRTDKVQNALDLFGGSGYLVQALAKDNGMTFYATEDLDPYQEILNPNCYTATTVQEWIDSKVAQAFDLDVYIGAVRWFPINPNHMGSRTNNFFVGPVDLGVETTYNVYKLDAQHEATFARYIRWLTLPTNNTFGDFRDCYQNFSRYFLRLPGVGIVEVDPMIIGSAIHDNIPISIEMHLDLMTGLITHYLRTGSDASGPVKVMRWTGTLSIDVPISKASSDMGKTVSSFAGSVAAGAVSGGAVGAVIGGVVGLVSAVHNELCPNTSIVGGSGNKAEIADAASSIDVIRIQYGAKSYPTAHAGRPLYQNVLLGNLSGFVKCGNASVPVNCNDGERDAINNFLNSGFYIE